MKSTVCAIILVALAVAALPPAVKADFLGPTATDGANAMTVSKALSLRFDRDNVCLIGNIVNRLPAKDDKYTFRDMTGSMIVDIDNDVFVGQTVTPQTRVRICGEVEAEILKPNEFEAEFLEIVR